FGMTYTGHQVTCAACQRIAMSVLNDLGSGRMFFGKPVRRIREIFNLSLIIRFFAVRYDFCASRFRRKISVLDRESPGQIFSLWLLRMNCERESEYDQHCEHRVFHRILRGLRQCTTPACGRQRGVELKELRGWRAAAIERAQTIPRLS